MPELGSRGEGWVALQVALIAALVRAGFAGERQRSPLGRGLGVALLPAGAWLVWAGFRELGPSLTPLPRPREDAELAEVGIYGRVRHPIYGGLVLGACGFSLVRERPGALRATAALALLLVLKARREEAWLLERYPGYAAYVERTPRRFWPAA